MSRLLDLLVHYAVRARAAALAFPYVIDSTRTLSLLIVGASFKWDVFVARFG